MISKIVTLPAQGGVVAAGRHAGRPVEDVKPGWEVVPGALNGTVVAFNPNKAAFTGGYHTGPVPSGAVPTADGGWVIPLG